MKFEDFIKKKLVRKGTPDKALAKSLLEASKNDLEYLKEQKITGKSARKITSNYYDVIRSMAEAITALEGYKVYSHEAFTYYLKEKISIETSKQFDRFRRIRNNINYYGKNIDETEAKEIIKSMERLAKKLREIIREKL